MNNIYDPEKLGLEEFSIKKTSDGTWFASGIYRGCKVGQTYYFEPTPDQAIKFLINNYHYPCKYTPNEEW